MNPNNLSTRVDKKPQTILEQLIPCCGNFCDKQKIYDGTIALVEENIRLKQQGAEMVAQVEVLRRNLQIAYDVITCADETGYVEDVGFVDIESTASNIATALSSTPAQCLRQIQADAGKAGWMACWNWLSSTEVFYFTDKNFDDFANGYADKVRQGGHL